MASVTVRRVQHKVRAAASCRERIGSACAGDTATNASSRARERRVPQGRPGHKKRAPMLRGRLDASVANFKARTVRLGLHAATTRNATQGIAPVAFNLNATVSKRRYSRIWGRMRS